ncbi:MAG: protein jag [Ruminococcus sp.]|nr:protein jag [Ruminococcus sp.]
MFKEVIATGATVEEAKENACKELGVETYDDRIEFEIIEMQAKKVFGLFGGRPAKVKVSLKQTSDQAAESFIKEIIEKMGLENITVSSKIEDNVITLDIEGEDVGFIIGRRGETLDALQYLACLAANRVDQNYSRVVINTGDYREKREKTLASLGRRLAIKAAKTGKKTSLEPMNPYERRIIHTAVQKVNGATSWSEGESVNRHVVIGPDPKNKSSYSGRGRGGRKSYGSGRGRGGYNKSEKPAPNPDRKPLNEGEGMGLYGRIDK